MAKEKKFNFSKKEWFWYILSLTLAFIGLVFAVIGIIGDHLPVKASDNWVRISEAAWLTNWSNMGYRYWGIILLCGGLVLFSFAATFFSRESDRDTERAARRAQRLTMMKEAQAAPSPEAPAPEQPKNEA